MAILLTAGCGHKNLRTTLALPDGTKVEPMSFATGTAAGGQSLVAIAKAKQSALFRNCEPVGNLTSSGSLVKSVSFNESASRLAVVQMTDNAANNTSTIELFDVTKPTPVSLGLLSPVEDESFGGMEQMTNLVWSPVDDDTFATISGGGRTIRVWRSGAPVSAIKYPYFAITLAWSPDGSQLLIGDDNNAVVKWDTQAKTYSAVLDFKLNTAAVHEKRIESIVWSSNGIGVSGSLGLGQIWLFDQGGNLVQQKDTDLSKFMQSARLSPTGDRWAIQSAQNIGVQKSADGKKSWSKKQTLFPRAVPQWDPSGESVLFQTDQENVSQLRGSDGKSLCKFSAPHA